MAVRPELNKGPHLSPERVGIQTHLERLRTLISKEK